jgi:hypothetical protein
MGNEFMIDEGESWGELLLRVLRNALLVDICIFAAVGIICWFIDWRTFYLYGLGLMFAGVGAIGLGLLSIFGNWRVTRNFQYQFSRSASHMDINQRLTQEIRDTFGSNAFMIILLIAGIVSILVGYLLQAVSS